MQIIEINKESDLRIDAIVKDENGTTFCYRFEPTLRTGEMDFLLRFKIDKHTSLRTYDLRRGLIDEDNLKIARELLKQIVE